MNDRQRGDPHETLVGRVQHGAGNVVAVGVGAVEHQNALAVVGRRVHDVVEGADVGVEARTDVLNVKDDHVDVSQVGGRRFLGLTVEGFNGQAGAVVPPVGDRRAGVGAAAETVLGGEDAPHVHAGGQEGIHQVGGAEYGGLVDDQGYAEVAQER